MERRKTPRYHLDEEDVDYTTETDYTYSLPSSTFESDFIGSEFFWLNYGGVFPVDTYPK